MSSGMRNTDGLSRERVGGVLTAREDPTVLVARLCANLTTATTTAGAEAPECRRP